MRKFAFLTSKCCVRTCYFYFVLIRTIFTRTALEPKRSTVSTPLNGQMIKNVTSCDAFAVDWVHDRIYWANCGGDGTSIMACGLNGDAEQTVLSRMATTGSALKRMEIDPYKGLGNY